MILTRVMVSRDSTLFKLNVKNKGINYQTDVMNQVLLESQKLIFILTLSID